MEVAPERFGRYLLLEPLGRGATGDVHLARAVDRDPLLPPLVVIKRLRDRHAGDEEQSRRFRHEAALAVKVDSPFIAKVYEAGAVGDTLYIALERVEGWSLFDVLGAMRREGRRATLSSAVAVIVDLLAALDALHTARDPKTGTALGIVHRDVSPKNIMLGESGGARLIDLGLGKSAIQDWKTATGIVMGTVGYMSPEQIGGQPVDRRSDLYAAAAVLYELITLEHYIERGPLPFMVKESLSPNYRAPTITRPEIPKVLEDVIRRGLAPDPAARFDSASEFSRALRQATPARSGGEPLAKIAHELLGAELEESKTAVTRLESRTFVVEHDTEVRGDTTKVYARAAEERAAPRAKSSVPTVIAMVAMLAAGIVIGRVALAPQPAPAPASPASRVETPAASAAPKIVARPNEEPPVIVPPAKPVLLEKPRGAPPAAGAAAAKIEPSVEVDATELARARRAALIERARTMRSAAAAPERADEINRVLAKLVLENPAGDPARVKTSLDRLEAELAKLSAPGGAN